MVMITNEPTSINDPCSVSPVCAQDPSSEEALVVAAQAGIRGAMGELLVRHRGTLLCIARRFVNTRDDAEDLVQDAMLRAIMNIGRFRRECRFGTWLIAIAKNSAVSMKRKDRTARCVTSEGEQQKGCCLSLWDIPDFHRNPEQESIHVEMLNLLRAAIANQSRSQQLVLSTCLFDERSIGASATKLGLTIGSVKSHLFRARRNLSETFASKGYTKSQKTSRRLERAEKA